MKTKETATEILKRKQEQVTKQTLQIMLEHMSPEEIIWMRNQAMKLMKNRKLN